MAHGNWTAGSASAVKIAANEFRDVLVIQHTNATQVALGIGIDAEAGKGLQLINSGDAVILRGHNARQAIYMIGNGATGTYQDGDCDVRPGPYVAE